MEKIGIQLNNNADNSALVVYYFDMECLPETPEESDEFGRTKQKVTEPQISVTLQGNATESIMLPMRRTKRAMNVFKCVVPSHSKSFKVIVDRKEFEKENQQFKRSTPWTPDKELDNPFQIIQKDTQFQGEIQLEGEHSLTNESNQKKKKNRVCIYLNEAIQVKERATTNNQGIVISTDLGGTLCGINEATIKFMKTWIRFFYFDKKSYLIYNTGRGIRTIYYLMRRESLILPDYYICRCGSGIYNKNPETGYLTEESGWKEVMQNAWKSQKIHETLIAKTSAWLKHHQRGSEEDQSLRYSSLSGIFSAHEMEFNAEIKELNATGNQVNSVVREKKGVTHVEIVPYLADKGIALEYILRKDKILGQNNPEEDAQMILKLKEKVLKLRNNSTCDYQEICIKRDNQDDKALVSCFGDTMNDEGMLRISEISIAVSNSEDQLKKWIVNQQNVHPSLKISDKPNAEALIEFLKPFLPNQMC